MRFKRAEAKYLNAYLTHNKIELNKNKPNQILVGGASHGDYGEGGGTNNTNKDISEQLKLEKKYQITAANSTDHKEGVKAFFEKRKPKYIGE